MSNFHSPIHTSDTTVQQHLTQLQIRIAVLETELTQARREKEVVVDSSVLIARNLLSFITAAPSLLSATSIQLAHSPYNTKCSCARFDQKAQHELIESYKKQVQELEMKLLDKDVLLKESLAGTNKDERLIKYKDSTIASLEEDLKKCHIRHENQVREMEMKLMDMRENLASVNGPDVKSKDAEIEAKNKLIAWLREELKEKVSRNEQLKKDIAAACGAKVESLLSKISQMETARKLRAARFSESEATTMAQVSQIEDSSVEEGGQNKAENDTSEHHNSNKIRVDTKNIQERIFDLENSLIGDEYTSTSPNEEASFSTTSTELIPQEEPAMPASNNPSGDSDLIDLEAMLDEAQDIVDEPQADLINIEHDFSVALGNTSDTRSDDSETEEIEQFKASRSFAAAPTVLSVGFDASKSTIIQGRYGPQSIPGEEEILSAVERWKIYSRPQAPRQFKNGDFINPEFDVDNIFYDPPETEIHPNRAVLIHNLPRNITIGEILTRVRGGLVLEAHLAPTVEIIGSMSAIVRFLYGTSAERYADFCTHHPQMFGGLVAKVDLIPTPSHPCPSHRRRGVTHFHQTRVLEVKNFPKDLTIRDMECDIAACSPIGAPQKYYEMNIVGEGDNRKLKIFCNSVERAAELMRSLRSAVEMSGLDLMFGEDPCKGWVEELTDSSQNVVKLSSHASDANAEVDSNIGSHVDSLSPQPPNNESSTHTSKPNTSSTAHKNSAYTSKSPSWADEVNEAIETGIIDPAIPLQNNSMPPATDSEVAQRKRPAGIAASGYSMDILLLGNRAQSQSTAHRPRRPSKLHMSFNADELDGKGEERAGKCSNGDDTMSVTFDILNDADAGTSGVCRSADKVTTTPLTAISVPLPSSSPSPPISPRSPHQESALHRTSTESETSHAEDEEIGGNKENSPPTRYADLATVAMASGSLGE